MDPPVAYVHFGWPGWRSVGVCGSEGVGVRECESVCGCVCGRECGSEGVGVGS